MEETFTVELIDDAFHVRRLSDSVSANWDVLTLSEYPATITARRRGVILATLPWLRLAEELAQRLRDTVPQEFPPSTWGADQWKSAMGEANAFWQEVTKRAEKAMAFAKNLSDHPLDNPDTASGPRPNPAA